jgi:hypothetical protein
MFQFLRLGCPGEILSLASCMTSHLYIAGSWPRLDACRRQTVVSLQLLEQLVAVLQLRRPQQLLRPIECELISQQIVACREACCCGLYV